MNKYAINTLLTDFTLMRGRVNIFFSINSLQLTCIYYEINFNFFCTYFMGLIISIIHKFILRALLSGVLAKKSIFKMIVYNIYIQFFIHLSSLLIFISKVVSVPLELALEALYGRPCSCNSNSLKINRHGIWYGSSVFKYSITGDGNS